MNPGYIDPDYVDVAERIRLFYERFPEGSLETVEHGLLHVGDRTFVWCKAEAYRSPPERVAGAACTGVAWAPVPGPTPFTRDSELMNAQTSAWGRAIVAAGIPSKKIASSDEVRTAQESQTPVALPDDGQAGGRTAKQNNELWRLLGVLAATKLTPKDYDSWKAWSRAWTEERFGKSSSKDLTEAECSLFIDELKVQEREAPEVPF